MATSFLSQNDDMAGSNSELSYFSRNTMYNTMNLDDHAHPTSQVANGSMLRGYTTDASNQLFAAELRLNTHGDTHAKAESQQFKIPNSPSKKRTKVAHPDATTQNSPQRSKGKQKKCLSLLLEMPIDVLFEIFSHLHPRDMTNLTRTSKIFRETLLSRSATTVWRAVCNKEGAPECPGWMSEPAWAALLFEHVCQSCGARNIQKIDFMLMKRVCLRCKKSHLVSISDIFRRYPAAAAHGYNMYNLLPATNISSWSHKYTRKREFFWDTDVEYMITRLNAFKQDIERGLPDAQTLQNEFNDKHKKRVNYIKENFSLWNDWHTNKRSSKRITSILERFLRNVVTFNSSQILPTVPNSILAPSNTVNPQTLTQMTVDSDEVAFSQDPFNFEKDFETFLRSEAEISLSNAFRGDFGMCLNDPQNAKEGMPSANEGPDLYRVDRDFGDWFTEADFYWYDNVGSEA